MHQPTDGKTYTISELTEGFVVGCFDPTTNTSERRAALTIPDVVRILKSMGLPIDEKPMEVH